MFSKDSTISANKMNGQSLMGMVSLLGASIQRSFVLIVIVFELHLLLFVSNFRHVWSILVASLPVCATDYMLLSTAMPMEMEMNED